MKFFKFIFSFSYLVFLNYIVFFARRRRSFHYNYKINYLPLKNLVHTFRTLNLQEKAEINNFYMNLFGNVILFIPFAFMLLALFRITKLNTIVLAALLVSTFIEITQYFFQIGLADIDDIILNTLGAIIGFYLYKLFSQMPVGRVISQAN